MFADDTTIITQDINNSTKYFQSSLNKTKPIMNANRNEVFTLYVSYGIPTRIYEQLLKYHLTVNM